MKCDKRGKQGKGGRGKGLRGGGGGGRWRTGVKLGTR